MRPCPACRNDHLLEDEEVCFFCWRAENPPVGVPNVRIDAAGDDSTNAQRVADGSARFNTGLRGIETVVGTRRDGKPAIEYRPISNAEVSSNRNRRELAKRQGLGTYESGVYRGLR